MGARKLVAVLFYYISEASKCKGLQSPWHMLVSLPRKFPSFHLPFKELNPPHLSVSGSDITSSAVLIDSPNLSRTELHHRTLYWSYAPGAFHSVLGIIQGDPSYRESTRSGDQGSDHYGIFFTIGLFIYWFQLLFSGGNDFMNIILCEPHIILLDWIGTDQETEIHRN